MPRKKKPTPFEKIDVALQSIHDGALHVGVALMREAVDEIEIVAKSRDAALEKMIGKRKPKAVPDGQA